MRHYFCLALTGIGKTTGSNKSYYLSESAHAHSAFIQNEQFRARIVRKKCDHFNEVGRKRNFQKLFQLFSSNTKYFIYVHLFLNSRFSRKFSLTRIKTHPLCLDDFNKSCTAVIVKKENPHQDFLRYLSQWSMLTISAVLGSYDLTLFKFIFDRGYLENAVFRAFKYLEYIFHLFVKKGFYYEITYETKFKG